MRWRWINRPNLLKSIVVVSLPIILRPLFPLALFSNPEEAVILGRYTLTFFLIIVSYSAVCLGWLVVTVWILRRADAASLVRWRGSLLDHRQLILPFLSLGALGLGLLNGVLAHTLIPFPGAVQTAFRLVPVTVLVCVWLLIGVVLHQSGEHTILIKAASMLGTLIVLFSIPSMVTDPMRPGSVLGRFSAPYAAVIATWIVVGIAGTVASVWLLLWWDQARQDAWGSWIDTRWSAHTRLDISLVGLVAAVIFLSALVIHEGLFTKAIYKDATVHVYIGQALLRGEVPYRDVLYFHPPLRFAVSAIWAGLSGLLNLPIVETARMVNLLFAMALLWILYRIGLNVTGQPIGGFSASLTYLLLPLTGEMLVGIGPTLKLTATVLVAANILSIQEKRWGWAGVLSAATVLMWLPAGAMTLGLGLAILLQRDRPWQAAGAFVAAGLAVTSVVGSVLALAGVLVPMLQQTVGAAFTVVATAAEVESRGFFSPQIWWLLLEWSGGVPMMIVYGIGLGVLGMRERLELFQKPEFSALLLGMTPLILFTLRDLIGTGDFIIVKILLAALGGMGLWVLLPFIWGDRQKTALLKVAIGGALIIIALLVLITPTSNRRRVSLVQQKELAALVATHLEPGDTVQSFDMLWYPVLSQTDNLLPPVQIRPKGMVANRAAGWSEEVIAARLLAAEPALILILPDNLEAFGSALSETYVEAGIWNVGDRKQVFLVHRDRPELLEALQVWWNANDD